MMQNLDIQCATLAEELGQGADKARKSLLTDGLGVLQDQGLYAFFLFLKASTRGNPRAVSDACASFLRKHGLLPDSQDVFDGLKTLCSQMDDLLFARELLLHALAYARYHAQVSQEGEAHR
ncbi:MAG: hypothetical protein H0Z37_03365 [Firmicutes bacterium]|nr:hypothetical protein [Bacillota bacterium]